LRIYTTIDNPVKGLGLLA